MIGGSKVSGFEYSGIFTSDEFYEPKVEEIYSYFNVSHSEYKWISGSIFWVRFDLINKLDDKFTKFVETNQPAGYFKDGTIVHGIERYFGKLAYDAGKIVSSDPVKLIQNRP
jgi:hypothetical protein